MTMIAWTISMSAVAGNVEDERAVDLQRIERQAFEVGQR
jgi:hypothetical protein